MNSAAIDTLIAYKSVVVGTWLALLFVAERLWPAAAEPPDLGARGGLWRLGRNAALWIINALLSPLVVLPLTAAATGQALDWRPAWWSGWAGVAIDLVLFDALIYGWHRLNHEAPLLWRFHQVHHLDRTLDTTSALRFHFGEVLLSALARSAAIIVLGMPLASVLAFETLLLAAAIFHHSNLRLPSVAERLMSPIFVTPGIHWVHHHARRADTDSNYGTLFSFWDRVFGTRSATRRSVDMPIGVENDDERSLQALLLRPFLLVRGGCRR